MVSISLLLITHYDQNGLAYVDWEVTLQLTYDQSWGSKLITILISFLKLRLERFKVVTQKQDNMDILIHIYNIILKFMYPKKATNIYHNFSLRLCTIEPNIGQILIFWSRFDLDYRTNTDKILSFYQGLKLILYWKTLQQEIVSRLNKWINEQIHTLI